MADAGGGIAAISGSTVDLTHVTIAQNTASSGGGINAPTNTVVTAQGSIVSANTGVDCAGTIVSAGHNLDSDGSCAIAETADQTLDQGLGLWVEVTEAITWTQVTPQ